MIAEHHLPLWSAYLVGGLLAFGLVAFIFAAAWDMTNPEGAYWTDRRRRYEEATRDPR